MNRRFKVEAAAPPSGFPLNRRTCTQAGQCLPPGITLSARGHDPLANGPGSTRVQYNSGAGDRSGLDRKVISLASTRSRCRSSLPGGEPRVSVEIARRAIRDYPARQVFQESNASDPALTFAWARIRTSRGVIRFAHPSGQPAAVTFATLGSYGGVVETEN